jgi:hypothetical protein
MKEYNDLVDSCLGGNEGYCFSILNPDVSEKVDDTILLELIAKHHTDKFLEFQENDYGPHFYAKHDNWLDFYRTVLDGQDVTYVEDSPHELLEELFKRGLIGDCLIWTQHYYETKYGFYCLENNKPVWMSGKQANLMTQEEVIDKLISEGKLENFYLGLYIEIENKVDRND